MSETTTQSDQNVEVKQTVFVRVVIFNSASDGFDYQMPHHLAACGLRVLVTLRGKPRIGIVSHLYPKTHKPAYTVNPIDDIIDEAPIIPNQILSLCEWARSYYQSTLSEALKNVLPKRLRTGKDLHPSSRIKRPMLPQGTSSKEPLLLNEEQAAAVKAISQSFSSYQCFLLFGITGSGKTEVYFHLMASALKLQKNVLILVPEIGLTPQLLSRVAARFKEPTTIIHSRLTDGERHIAYFDCLMNQSKIIIGTRSAIFAPINHLGLIIIDEEHDLSFKQQDSMRYHARDIAIKRAHDLNIPIVLGSATPSLESFYNTVTEKSQLLTLTKTAIESGHKKTRIVDMRGQKVIAGLCEKTLASADKALSQGGQVMVFINRRGYSPVMICHQCAWCASCPHCSTSLTLHLEHQRLKCHHCLYQTKTPQTCPSCHGHELLPIGAGTERLAEHLSQHFSQYKTLRVDRDTIKHKGELDKHLQAINNGECQLIIGTQMLAKGHHFPKLTLVIIVDIDASFYSLDFRAQERLAQLITQVSGRTGRVGSGEVILQTYQPNHPFFKKLIEGGYLSLCQELIKQRQQVYLPPATHLALIRCKGRSQQKQLDSLKAIKAWLSNSAPDILLLGPATAPIEKKAGLFHCQLLIKSHKRKQLHLALTKLRHYIKSHKALKKLNYSIDIDCQDFS